jgi:ATP-dependent RNA helicase DDX35
MQLKALGIDNIVRFDFLTPPPAELVIRAFELLSSLGAVDDYAKLTKPLGTRMAELAVDPMMAKVLLAAPSFNCLSEILSIAAMVSLQGTVWVQHEGDKRSAESNRRKFAVEEGDHLTYLNVYQAFVTKGKKDSKWCRDNLLNYRALLRAVSIRGQLKRYLERFGIQIDETLSARNGALDLSTQPERIRRCLTTGYFAHAAKMQPDGTFKTVSGGLTLHAHPSSLMFVSILIIWLEMVVFVLLTLYRTAKQTGLSSMRSCKRARRLIFAILRRSRRATCWNMPPTITESGNLLVTMCLEIDQRTICIKYPGVQGDAIDM